MSPSHIIEILCLNACLVIETKMFFETIIVPSDPSVGKGDMRFQFLCLPTN